MRDDWALTLIWFVVWLIANVIGDHEPLLFNPVNWWTGTLLGAIAIDLSRQHASKALLTPCDAGSAGVGSCSVRVATIPGVLQSGIRPRDQANPVWQERDDQKDELCRHTPGTQGVAMEDRPQGSRRQARLARSVLRALDNSAKATTTGWVSAWSLSARTSRALGDGKSGAPSRR
jgi:hypothetical protein